MTNQQHPITPPPELVREWRSEWMAADSCTDSYQNIATQAARWGADQELEACCEWFIRDWTDVETADKLRAARRPKPPSLKEQAIAALTEEQAEMSMVNYKTIRTALDSLPS